MNCNICPKNCNINRNINYGFCKTKEAYVIARAALHHFEEPIISGTKGSGAVFFCGCNLRCSFCQNYEISSKNNKGKEITDKQLKIIFENLINNGAHNINLVTPTHYTKNLAKFLENKFSVPIIWNSSAYEKKDALKLLDKKVDIYLPDLKYLDDALAFELSSVNDYSKYAKSAIEEMVLQRGKPILENNLLKSGVVVRHLVLPGFVNNTLKVIDYIAENFKNDILFSLMFQYVPINKQKIDSLNRRVNNKEYDIILNHLYKKGIEEGFVQNLSSASKKYIPDFNCDGLNI